MRYTSIGWAVFLSLVTTLMLALMNASAKWAGMGGMGVMDVAAWRSVMGLGLMLVIGWTWKGRFDLRTERPLSHLTRSMLGHAGVALVFWSYQRMPMAEATTILYLAPLITVMLSIPLLREKVGPWRMAGCFLGLAGVAVMMGPGSGALSMNDLGVGVAAALGIALVNIVLRDIGKTDEPIVTVNWFFVWGTVLAVPWLIIHPVWPAAALMPALACVSVAAVIAHLAKTQAARLAEASLIAPIHYAGLIWSVLLGFLMFGDVPGIWTVLGSAIIIGGNGIVLWREYIHKKKTTQDVSSSVAL